jgi:hypothetical protein
MPAADFQSLVKRRRDSCVKFTSGKPSRERREAMQFYRGDNLSCYGDSGDGQSTVVSRDVMEAIESVMPPLLRPFVAGEQVVSFDPVEETDEASTKQATEYVNYVLRRDNNVLDLTQTGLKDGLLYRLGIAKTVCEEEEGNPEAYEGLAAEELAALDPARISGDILLDEATGTYSVTLAPKTIKRYRVHIIAPDEFLYEERLTSLRVATFLGHRKQVSLADLVEMGIPEETAIKVSSEKPSEENDDRFDNEDDEPAELASNDPNRMIWVDECYIKCNYSGAGMEWRKVLLGGSETAILTNEPADDHPYSAWTPIPIPHKLSGLSFYDLNRDIQMQKTALQREQLNNLYLVNRPQRTVLEGQASIDDLLQPSIGGIVRVKDHNAVKLLTTPFVADAAFPMIEYLDGVREARTGVTRYNQGMDANSLNKTATGINIISNNSQQRQELVARQFGEFLKDIFEKLLALVIAHSEEADVVRLLNTFVPWPEEYDTTVSVGLGTNNKDQLVGHLMGLLQLDQSIVQLQQGVNGPLLTAANIYEKLKRLPEAMGMKGTFYSDPSQMPPAEQGGQDQPEQPSPDQQLKAQTDLQKTHMDNQTDLAIAQMRQPPAFPVIDGGLAG